MTFATFSQLMMWFAVVVNIATTVLVFLRSRRHDKAMRAQFSEAMGCFAPALAFAVAVRDSPTAPPELREAAAAALPPQLVVTRSDGRVH